MQLKTCWTFWNDIPVSIIDTFRESDGKEAQALLKKHRKHIVKAIRRKRYASHLLLCSYNSPETPNMDTQDHLMTDQVHLELMSLPGVNLSLPNTPPHTQKQNRPQINPCLIRMTQGRI